MEQGTEQNRGREEGHNRELLKARVHIQNWMIENFGVEVVFKKKDPKKVIYLGPIASRSEGQERTLKDITTDVMNQIQTSDPKKSPEMPISPPSVARRAEEKARKRMWWLDKD